MLIMYETSQPASNVELNGGRLIANRLSQAPLALDDGIGENSYLFWDLEDFNTSNSKPGYRIRHDSTLSSGKSSENEDIYDEDRSKRFVHFADSEGKPLVSVRVYERDDQRDDDYFYCDGFDSDQYGSWHMTAMLNRLTRMTKSSSNSKSSPARRRSGQHPVVSRVKDQNKVKLLFPDPLSNYSKYVTEKLRTTNVALESVICKADSIKGLVRVFNLGYKKNVYIRFTWDGWATYYDWKCDVFRAIQKRQNTQFEQFEFSIPVPPHLKPDAVVEFCICYRFGEHCEFWDNNYGKNFGLRFSQRQVKSAILSESSESDSEENSSPAVRTFLWSEFALWNRNSCTVDSNCNSFTSSSLHCLNNYW